MKFTHALAAIALSAVAANAAAADKQPIFVPLTESAMLQHYGNAERIAPGVYTFSNGEQTLTAAYGAAGLRFRIAELEGMAAAERARGAKGTHGRPGIEHTLRAFRSQLATAEASREKGYSDLYDTCGAHDGYVYAEATREPGFNWANAIAAASFDGFGPAPEGNFYVETQAMQQYGWNRQCSWVTTGHSQALVTSVYGASTGDYTTVSDSASTEGGMCGDVYAIAQFKHESTVCVSVTSAN